MKHETTLHLLEITMAETKKDVEFIKNRLEDIFDVLKGLDDKYVLKTEVSSQEARLKQVEEKLNGMDIKFATY